jgi:uridine phosphorylase
MNDFQNSEIVKDSTNKQYHIGLKPDNISNKIILVGDPKRAELISKLFDDVLFHTTNREFVTFTGIYKGIKLTVMSTGMGAPNTEIAVIELCQLQFPLTIIRCGTCGALQTNIAIGDFVISSGAVRLENTTSYFVENNYPALSSYEVNLALFASANNKNSIFHYGITATAAGFYGSQCRNVPGFPLKDPSLLDRLTKQNVQNFEMETSALLTLSNLRGFRAGSICAVVSSRHENKFANLATINLIEKNIIKVCLDSFVILEIMDKQKEKNKLWFPNIKIP